MDLKKIEAIAKAAAFISAAAIGFVGLGIIETVKLKRLLLQWARSQGRLSVQLEESIDTDKKLLASYEQMITLLCRNDKENL